ncbi:hypothetical protein ACFXDE_03895 [Kitasatospora sp. NPDC059408]|uniref:hypothetical protein n=1 Tax=Kitasatospora sp. NPDC059408 TaxID=3346823 RepID=UPI0036BFC91F
MAGSPPTTASRIRAGVLYQLAGSPVDTPEMRAVMAAHLADPNLDIRIEAAAGLALRGDERGLPVLDGIRRGIKNHWSPGAGRLADIGSMLRARARSAG